MLLFNCREIFFKKYFYKLPYPSFNLHLNKGHQLF